MATILLLALLSLPSFHGFQLPRRQWQKVQLKFASRDDFYNDGPRRKQYSDDGLRQNDYGYGPYRDDPISPRDYYYDQNADYQRGGGTDEFRRGGGNNNNWRNYDDPRTYSQENDGYYDYPPNRNGPKSDARRQRYGVDWQTRNNRLNEDQTRWYDGSTQQRSDRRFGNGNYDIQRNARDSTFYPQASRDDYFYSESNNFRNDYVDDTRFGNGNRFDQRRRYSDSSNRNEQRFQDNGRYEDRDYSRPSRNAGYNDGVYERESSDRSYDNYNSQQQRQNSRSYDRRGGPYNDPRLDPLEQNSMMPFMPNSASFGPLSSIMPSFPALFRNMFSMPFNFGDDIASDVLQRILQQAKDRITNDPKINQLMGNRIQFSRPFSQNIASNTFNGKSSSFAKASFDIFGTDNRGGVATVEARDGSINFLAVDFDGQRIMIDGRQRRDDVVDAEIID